jgi:hypothetical protein
MMAQRREVGRVAEDAVHENDRNRVAVRLAERVGRHRAQGEGADDLDEGEELTPEDSQAAQVSRPASRVSLALHLASPCPMDAKGVPENPASKVLGIELMWRAIGTRCRGIGMPSCRSLRMAGSLYRPRRGTHALL